MKLFKPLPKPLEGFETRFLNQRVNTAYQMLLLINELTEKQSLNRICNRLKTTSKVTNAVSAFRDINYNVNLSVNAVERV